MPDSPPTITSRDNQVIKRIRSLQRSSTRYAERAFLVEGVRAVLDGIESGNPPELVLLSDDYDAGSLADQLSPHPVRIVDHRLLATLTNTVTPQGIIAVFPIPSPARSDTKPELSLVMDGISDPGNVGTLLRTAAAAGASRVLLTPGTADPYNPKVVRSAMGAHFRMAIDRLEPHTVIPAETTILLLTAKQQTDYTAADMTGPTWIVVGSEAHGVQHDFGDHPVVPVSLPMPGGMESLNAAVAGSIALYEALRQRSHKNH